MSRNACISCIAKPLSLILLVLVLLSPFPTLTHASQPITLKYRYGIRVTLPALAVSTNGEGVVSQLEVQVLYPGGGEVYFSAEPLTMLDSQASARIAVLVAASLTGIDYRKYDFMIALRSPSLIIGGPSAGGVMTVGVIAALLNATINDKVAMTGMINPDGTIGPVGGIPEKLRAAAAAGYKIFLIPVGQSIVYDEKITREKTPLGYITRIETQRVNLTSLGEQLGVKVVEVSTAAEAAEYFLNISMKGTSKSTSSEAYTGEQKELFQEWYSRLRKDLEERLESIYNIDEQKLPENSRKSLEELLKHINQTVSLSEKKLAEGKYYTSLSKIFQGLVEAESLYIQLYINNNYTRIKEYIGQVNRTIIEAEKGLSNIPIQTLSGLEAYITASSRIKEAREELLTAERSIVTLENLVTGEEKTLVQDTQALALARWRAETALQWMEYANISSPEIDPAMLRRVASYLLYDAETVLTYYSSLGGDRQEDYQELLNLYSDARTSYDKKEYAEVIADSITVVAKTTTGIHSLYNSDLEKTAIAVIDNARKALSTATYRSAIAIGYLEIAQDDLSMYRENNQKSYALAALNLAILSSLYAKLAQSLSPSESQNTTMTRGNLNSASQTVNAENTSSTTNETTSTENPGKGEKNGLNAEYTTMLFSMTGIIVLLATYIAVSKRKEKNM